MAAFSGPVPIDGVRMPTWLLRFEADGASVSADTRQKLLDELRAHSRSDVFIFSHGWNNDFDAAVDLYREFMHNFEQLERDHPRPGGATFDPLFIGVLWPSIWLSFDNGPAIAAADDDPVLDVVRGELERSLAGHGADAAAIERVRALLAKPSLGAIEAEELATLVAPAFGPIRDDEASGSERATAPSDLLFALDAVQQAQRGPTASADPDDWGESPAEVAAGGTGAATSTVRTAGLLDALDPRNAIRLFSVYRMKDRAGTVGFHGVAALLRDVLAATAATGTAVHGIGHSYGCKVMLSAICSPAPLPRPLRSLLLLQPAISHLSFAARVPDTDRAGGYVAALAPDRVEPPIYTTYSKKDFPLHETFHLSLRRAADLGEVRIAADGSTSAGAPPSRFAALGGYGPRGAGEWLVDPIPSAGSDYPVPPAGTRVVSFDGSADRINGHGDIKGPIAAWALHRLVFR